MAKKVSVSKKPTAKVKGLTALTRKSSGSYVFRSTWSVDSSAKSESNNARVEGFDVQILLDLYDVRDGAKAKKKKTLTYERRSWWKDRKEWEFDLGTFKLKTSDKKWYTRANDFYPGSNAHWLGIRAMTIRVRCINSKGVGPWVSQERKFYQPKAPSVTKLEMVSNTGVINCTVSHNKGSGNYDSNGYGEIYNTRSVMDVYDSSEKKNLTESHKEWYIARTEGSGSNNTIDVYDRMSDSYNEYRQVTVSAYSRGLWGPSKTVTKRLQVGWPKQPKITSVNFAEKKTSAGSTYLDAVGKVTVNIDTFTHPATEAKNNVINHHPATGVKLEKLVNQPYSKVEEIPGDADWTECGAVDNGVCSALSSIVSELRSTAGNYTWVRLKSWNQVEDIFFRYSMPWRLTKLYVPPETSTDDRATIFQAQVGDDGKSAIIGFQWKTDDSTGTEVSWSDDSHAWQSTNEPKTFKVTRKDGTRKSGSVTYNYANLYVTDLTEGKEYYFKVRRYKETDDDPIYGPYSATRMVTPYTSPDTVTLVAPTFVRRGGTTTLSWSFETEAKQKRWELICGTVTQTSERVRVIGTDTYVTRTRYTIANEKTVKTLAVGKDELTGYTLSWGSVRRRLINNDHIFIAVRVDTGGGYVLSDAMRVEIADAPVISAITANTLTAQPLSIGVTCDTAAQLSLIVESQGVSGEYADGDRVQAAGDTVWSVATTPGWTQSNGTYTATIQAPAGLTLYDNATYTIKCTATDETTGLVSEEVTQSFEVDYAHKATQPAESIEVEPYDVTDATGYRTRGARIHLAPPTYNRVEFFNRPLSDSSYWTRVRGLTASDLGDGWAHFEATNDGSSLVNYNSALVNIDSLTPGGTYTLLIEFRNLSLEGPDGDFFFYSQQSDDAQVWGIESTGGFSVRYSNVKGLTEGNFYRQITLLDEESRDPNGTVHGNLPKTSFMWFSQRVQPGQTISYDLRLSLYDGEYDGEYADPSTVEAAATDVYDVFRVTPDGPYLVAEGLALDAVVNDPWAPYGETHFYRVRTRTVDGCEESADYQYELAGRDLRIDWDGRYIELPYDLGVSDQYEKDFEARRHLDGSVDGYWNQGAIRRGNLKTNIIKARDADKAAALRALGRHAGPCFVRLPDGCAYQADVQLSGIDRESGSFAMAVSISATEVALTEDYMAVIPTEEG